MYAPYSGSCTVVVRFRSQSTADNVRASLRLILLAIFVWVAATACSTAKTAALAQGTFSYCQS